jgi:hypothetical protein
MERIKIEGYENYSINKKGEVRNDKTEKLLKVDLKNGYFYVVLSKNNKKKHYYIHRGVSLAFIPNPNNYLFIDHINRNKTDNRIENLRWCNKSQNSRNMEKHENTSSKYKGVYFHKKSNKWMSCCSINGKRNYIGLFKTEIESAEAYNNFIKNNNSEDFSIINII